MHSSSKSQLKSYTRLSLNDRFTIMKEVGGNGHNVERNGSRIVARGRSSDRIVGRGRSMDRSAGQISIGMGAYERPVFRGRSRSRSRSRSRPRQLAAAAAIAPPLDRMSALRQRNLLNQLNRRHLLRTALNIKRVCHRFHPRHPKKPTRQMTEKMRHAHMHTI